MAWTGLRFFRMVFPVSIIESSPSPFQNVDYILIYRWVLDSSCYVAHTIPIILIKRCADHLISITDHGQIRIMCH